MAFNLFNPFKSKETDKEKRVREYSSTLPTRPTPETPRLSKRLPTIISDTTKAVKFEKPTTKPIDPAFRQRLVSHGMFTPETALQSTSRPDLVGRDIVGAKPQVGQTTPSMQSLEEMKEKMKKSEELPKVVPPKLPPTPKTPEEKLTISKRYNVSDDEKIKVLSVVLGESGYWGREGDDINELHAMLNVINNRALTDRNGYGFGENVFNVISARDGGEFNAFANGGNDKYRLTRDYLRGNNLNVQNYIKDSTKFIDTLYEQAKVGNLGDISEGALFFVNPNATTKEAYEKFKIGRIYIKTIGEHEFYK